MASTACARWLSARPSAVCRHAQHASGQGLRRPGMGKMRRCRRQGGPKVDLPSLRAHVHHNQVHAAPRSGAEVALSAKAGSAVQSSTTVPSAPYYQSRKNCTGTVTDLNNPVGEIPSLGSSRFSVMSVMLVAYTFASKSKTKNARRARKCGFFSPRALDVDNPK